MKRYTSGAILLLLAGALTKADTPATQPAAGAWPMWGGAGHRNAVSTETNIPHLWDLETKENVKWSARLGSYAYAGPIIADGRVYVGTNNAAELRSHSKGDRGCLLCFDADTGKLLWHATHEKLEAGAPVDWPDQGVASSPYIDGERVYYVSNRCELVCADARGFHDNENDGPCKDEKFTEAQDADIIWTFDMIGQLGVYPHNLAACAPVGAGDLIFVCTSNGIGEDDKLPAPQAPSFIAVNKQTGKLVWQRNDPGPNILHGQWSSPAYAVIRGQPQVIFGGGDGWCYAFAATTGQLIWKFNLNPPDSVWKPNGSGTKTSIVATPVIHDDKVFLAVGDDPEQADGPGHLYAIDATRTGDITTTGRVWHFGGEDFGRTISSVAITDGLLYASDLNGFLSCLDVKTGKRLWQYDMEAAVWASPCVIDGKVMLGSTDGEMIILQHGREMKELARIDMLQSIYTSPVAVDGVLYIATQRTLHAIQAPTPKPTTKPASKAQWPSFRGNPQLTGVAPGPLPEKLNVRWRHDAGEPISSTAAIVDGTVFVGTEDGTVLALDLANGTPKWQHTNPEQDPIESSPAVVNGLVIFGDDAGVLRALDTQTGKQRWTFETDGQIISSVNHVDSRLLFGSYDSHLYCLDALSGKLHWKYTTGDRVHATPAIAEQFAMVGGCDAQLHVVNIADGSLVRKIELGSVTGCSAAISGDHAYLATHGEQILGIDWRQGKVIWRFSDPDRPQSFIASAALTDGLVIIGGRDKRLRALDQKTDQERWQFATKGQLDSSPVVAGGRVYVGSTDGTLYAVDINTGQPVWQFETGVGIHASPAVAAGCLVIGTDDGMIYCFGQ
ncbi:MAG: PQQ-binding-like beta-propeller repeat protein [Planctomycetota bacterium]